jgi:hypothetical protein
MIEGLTEPQRLIIDDASADVFTSKLENFYKYIADTLAASARSGR